MTESGPRSAESTRQQSATLLGLPAALRSKIYQQILHVPHPIYLYPGPGSTVQSFAPDAPSNWLALLYTNRQISREASSVLYEANQFEVVDINRPQMATLQPFLDSIGPMNAASISWLCLGFPTIPENEDPTCGGSISEDFLRVSDLLANKCSNLTTLEAVIHHNNAELFEKPHRYLEHAIAEIHQKFKTRLSVHRIIIRIDYQGLGLTDAARAMMEGLGWILSGTSGSINL